VFSYLTATPAVAVAIKSYWLAEVRSCGQRGVAAARLAWGGGGAAA